MSHPTTPSRRPRERFPWTRSCDAILAEADALDPADTSEWAGYLREVAQSVLEHRHGRTDPRSAS